MELYAAAARDAELSLLALGAQRDLNLYEFGYVPTDLSESQEQNQDVEMGLEM